MTNLTDELSIAIAELDEDKVMALVRERLRAGVEPLEIVKKLQDGMTRVGELFETGEYYLSELINCGEIMKGAMGELEPSLAGGEQKYRGNIVIGTVKGDIHDLGKNIVVMLLKGTGYNVIDLGVDVPPAKFIEAVKENNAPLLALSVLLTSCLDSMKEVVEEVKKSGLDVKVLIGGPIIDDQFREYCGADYSSNIASDGVKYAEKVFG
ncbi:MAG TPA: 5-methyltetrahydrofolate--homocysteine methyltransferase [Firmicutes bacterium]|jgi:5-methyltetrahydrofolate--homocysteine methyltransferase|nr:5-methyltetrahydrofolate--homocysteine methyltransferase [Bacillota bacterium]